MALESAEQPSDQPSLPPAVAAALRDAAPGTRRFVDAPGRRWSVLEWGDATDQPLLLIHGVTSSAGTWWRVGPALAAAGHRVVAPDLPGHGLTGGWRGQHRIADSAAEVAGLMRFLDLPVDTSVVGHSWGGAIAAALPAAGPRPRRLVLLDPPAMSRVIAQAMVDDPSETSYANMAAAARAVRGANPSWSDGDVAMKAEALMQFDHAAARDVLLGNEWDAGLTGLASWSADEVETWLVRGDPEFGGLTPDDAVEMLAGYVDPERVMTIPRGEHSPHRALAQATTAALLQALGRV